MRFFDHWLKGIDTGVMNEPPVKLLIRTGGGKGYKTSATRTNGRSSARAGRSSILQPVKAATRRSKTDVEGVLNAGAAENAGQAHLSDFGRLPRPASPPRRGRPPPVGQSPRLGISFETEPFEQDTEVTGPVNLVLWVSSTTEDMDIFATIRNIDPDGKDVWEIGQQQQPVPVAKGWQRASHRKLDPKLSTPYRPYHAHDERQWLKPGEVVQVRGRSLAHLHGVQERAIASASISSRATASAARPTPTIMAITIPAEKTRSTPAARCASYLLLPIIPSR